MSEATYIPVTWQRAMGGDGGLVCGGVQITEQMEVVMSIAAYSACSGTMLIANKLTLHLIPAVRAPFSATRPSVGSARGSRQLGSGQLQGTIAIPAHGAEHSGADPECAARRRQAS